MPSVHEGEGIGLLYAIQWLRNVGVSSAIIELDCKMVIDGLDNRISNKTEFGVVLNDCRNLLNCYSNYQVRFVKRQTNLVAHVLAKVLNNYAPSFKSFEIPHLQNKFIGK